MAIIGLVACVVSAAAQPAPRFIVHHYSWPGEAAAKYAQLGYTLWEIDVRDPTKLADVDRGIDGTLKRCSDARLILRVNLHGRRDRDDPSIDWVVTDEHGQRYGLPGGPARWLHVGWIDHTLAPPGRWTKVVFDLPGDLKRDRIVRPFEIDLWNGDEHNPAGRTLRFYFDDVEYLADGGRAAQTVADMENLSHLADTTRRTPLLSSQHARRGKALVLEASRRPGKGGAAAVYMDFGGYGPDLSPHGRIALWVYPDCPAPYRLELRVVDRTGPKSYALPSLVADEWAAEAEATLERLVRHLVSRPYAHNIVGITLAAGICGEWCYPAHCTWIDFSPAAQRAWRAWLRARFHAIDTLNEAYGGSWKNFEEVPVPGKKVRDIPGDLGEFVHPSAHPVVLDYLRFLNESVAARIAQFARAVKRAGGRRLMVGCLFPYIFDYGPDRPAISWQQSGYNFPAAALDSDDVDFFCSPFSYWGRYPGGFSLSALPTGSISARGKLVINEADSFTHLVPPEHGLFAAWPGTLAESQGMLRRDVACTIAHRAWQWWFISRLGPFDRLGPLAGELRALAGLPAKLAPRDLEPVAQVAVVINPRSSLFMRPLAQQMTAGYFQAAETAHIGAPFEVFLADDLPLIARENYKLVVLAVCWQLDGRARKAIKTLLGRGATVVCPWVTGIVGDDRADVRYVADLTGLRLSAVGQGIGEVEVDPGGHRLLRGLPGGYRFGREMPRLPEAKATWTKASLKPLVLSPRLVAAEGHGQVLGRLVDTGRPGLVVVRHGAGAVIWTASAWLPAPLLRNAALSAGVHIYADGGDVVYATRGFVAVHAAYDGKHLLRLPRRVEAVDLITGRLVCEGAAEVELHMERGQTALLRLR